MRLRLLTWNVHKGIGGLDRRYRPERVVSVLEHYAPDLVLLQEVDDGARRSGVTARSTSSGAPSPWQHRCFSQRPGARRRSYGNAVLSRFPIAAAATST